jgi:sodium/hydrogen antiporter
MSGTLATVALAVLVVAAVSRRLSGGPITPAMLFVGLGLLAGPRVLGEVDVPPTAAAVRILAEATLALVLFADAARIDVRALRRDYGLPLRLLSIGLPLTIAAGALCAALLFGSLSIAEALVLAVLLAPTDAALGQAVVTEPRLPVRIRQGLNVESGLNDGICVPLLLIVLAGAEADAHATTSHHAVTVVLEEIGYGVLGGVAAGGLAAAIVLVAGRRGLIADSWLRVIPVASAALAYGIADPLGDRGSSPRSSPGCASVRWSASRPRASPVSTRSSANCSTA